MTRRTVFALLAAGALAGCDGMPSWMGGSKKVFTPLPGERVAVLPQPENILRPDPSLAPVSVALPPAEANTSWPQQGGHASGHLDHPALLPSISPAESATAGKGAAFEHAIPPAPVAGEGLVFAADAEGFVSAHDARDLDSLRWVSKGTSDEDERETLGGGLAYDAGTLFATSGRGLVVALKAATGEEIWRQPLGIPLRPAPKTDGRTVFVLSIDNQLFALDARTGSIRWNHRGMSETAGFLGAASPSLSDNLVVAPYSSGELYALNSADGKELWSDSLGLSKRTVATALFGGIGGQPVISGNIVYAASKDGLLAATRLETGQRLWEQPIPSLHSPWVAGDYVYVLSAESVLVCLERMSGRIKWTRALRSFEDEERKETPLTWAGPVLAGGRLLVAGAHGELVAVSPADGSMIGVIEIPEGVRTAPIVANGTVYLIDTGATLHALR